MSTIYAKPTGWLVSYDFSGRPPQKFYDLLSILVDGGGLKLEQKSVYKAKDAEDAATLVALLEWYRAANVKAIPVAEGTLDQAADRQAARQRIEAMHVPKKRGRKPGIKRKGK